MSSRVVPRLLRTLAVLALLFTLLAPARHVVRVVYASPAYQPLPFAQDWSDAGLITIDDFWDNVPGFVGYRGDGLTGTIATDPQELLADGSETPIDVMANQTDPATNTTGGLAEFALPDPVVALQPSATADAPHLVLHLNTLGYTGIQVSYVLRDIDTSPDNAVQPVAFQYRIGESGAFTDLPLAYRGDASFGPNLTRTLQVSITLPSALNNQPQLQLRWITANASGADEWIGIDDVSISGTPTGGDIAPYVAEITPVPNGVGVDPAEPIRLRFSEAVDLAADAASLVCAGDPVSFSGLPANNVVNLTLTPAAALPVGGRCTLTLDPAKITDNDGTADQLVGSNVFNFSLSGGCADPIVTISTIQGSGNTSPCNGRSVLVEAVVVGDYEGGVGANALFGFYLQEEPADQDSDPATSEGLFVVGIGSNDVALGDRVRIRGTVSEVAGQTQLTTTEFTILANNVALVPVAASMSAAAPVNGVPYLERYEGMLISFAQTLYVSDPALLDEFGQVTLSSDGRLIAPTQLVEPGESALAVAAANERKQLIVDDASQGMFPDPILFGRGANPLSASNTLRAGDTITGLRGVLTYSGNGSEGSAAYRLRPINALGGGAPNFQPANPRPAAPAAVGGEVTVASFNLGDYFNTFSGCLGGVGGATTPCLGAENSAEYERQRQKVTAALAGLDADVIALVGLENDGYNTSANPIFDAVIQHLLEDLNSAVPGDADDYTFVLPDAALDQVNALGTAATKVGLLYRFNRVDEVSGGTFVSSDPNFERSPLVQVFAQLDGSGTPTGEQFAVAVNDFTGRGDCPASGDPNADQGDGQGCWNARRVAQATALLSLINDTVLPAAAMDGDRDVLIVGDLHAYAQEDPITVLKDAGYVDLPGQGSGDAYTYGDDGAWGYSDHALASPTLAAQVSGVTMWHINADEPDALDYNTNNRSTTQQTTLYGPDAYRSSAHDPILVGLNLAPPPPNRAPTLSVIDLIGGATQGEAFTLTYAALAAAANESDPDGDPVVFRVEQVLDGTLTKGGTNITPGTTSLGPGEELVYTPASSGSSVDAFTVVASDGALASVPPVAVRFVVAEAGNPNQAPTLTTVAVIGGAELGRPFTLSYGALAAAADESDPDGDPLVFRIEQVLDGTLTRGGTAVTPGVTTLAAGESLVYTPATSGSAVAAFRIVASDGSLASTPPVTVRFAVSETDNPNQAPTLTAINVINGATLSQPFTLTYAALASAANESDPDGDPLVFRVEQILDGMLTKNGEPVTAGTTLAPGEALVYTPASSGSAVAAFSVVTSDGVLASSPAVPVRFGVIDPENPETEVRLYLPLLYR